MLKLMGKKIFTILRSKSLSKCRCRQKGKQIKNLCQYGDMFSTRGKSEILLLKKSKFNYPLLIKKFICYSLSSDKFTLYIFKTPNMTIADNK